MNREYHRWYSPSLGRDMELLIFGHAGAPVLVFPTSMGKFFEYENNGMIGPIAGPLEWGQIQLFCIDSVDTESWYNKGVHPYVKVRRHAQYEEYILREVLPLMRVKNPDHRLHVTGCSFGGYHCVNFALRHPDIVDWCVSMSGAYDIKQFMWGYYDDMVYFNNPPDYLPNMSDDWFLSRYRNSNKFLLATSEWDICLDQNLRLSRIMGAKGIPHSLDVWGSGWKHDWPLWREMSAKYFGSLR